MPQFVKLVIGPRGSGKTEYVLNQIESPQDLLVVSQNANPEDFVNRLDEKNIPHRGSLVINEEALSDEIEKRKFETVHFTDLFSFVENVPRHLDLFCSVAQFAATSDAQVWGEISIGPTEVQNCREAIQALVKFAPSTEVTEVSLRDGAALLLTFDARKILEAAASAFRS